MGMGKIYTHPVTRNQWWIKTLGLNLITTFTLHGPKGEVKRPSQSYTLHDLPQHLAEGFLADNETHLRDPILATADWVLDQIIAKEANGIDCRAERQYAKHYFSEPRFTPLRGLTLPELADSDLAGSSRIDSIPAQGATSGPRIDFQHPDGSWTPSDPSGHEKGARKPPLPASHPEWEDVPF